MDLIQYLLMAFPIVGLGMNRDSLYNTFFNDIFTVKFMDFRSYCWLVPYTNPNYYD